MKYVFYYSTAGIPSYFAPYIIDTPWQIKFRSNFLCFLCSTHSIMLWLVGEFVFWKVSNSFLKSLALSDKARSGFKPVKLKRSPGFFSVGWVRVIWVVNFQREGYKIRFSAISQKETNIGILFLLNKKPVKKYQ